MRQENGRERGTDSSRPTWSDCKNPTLRLLGPRAMTLQEEEIPSPAPGEVLLRVTAVGICGSDLHWWEEGGIGESKLERPLVLGHEFAGHVETGRLAGARVAVEPSIHCAVCDLCRRGHPNLCESVRFAGHGEIDGALRRWIAWPESLLFPLPDNVSDAAGAMLEPLGVALHTLDLAHFRLGESAAVIGCGPIGLMILQLLRRAGASWIAATDRLPHRLEAARKYGADFCSLAKGEEVESILRQRSAGVDVVFEAAGDRQALEACVEIATRGGRVLLVGIPPDDQICFSAAVSRRKGLTVKLVRRMKHTYPRATWLVSSGLVEVESLITHRFSLEEYDGAFAAATRREGLKVLLEPWRAPGG